MEEYKSDLDKAIASSLSVEVDLEPLEIEAYSLRTGNTDVVAVQPFRKCSITTKVTDLQHCYFVDGRTGQKRDVCVVFLQFQFDRQKQGGHFNRRITEMTIAIRAERSGQPAGAAPAYSKDAVKGEEQLVMKAVLPRIAMGPAEHRSVKTSVGANLSPEAGGISLGGADLTHEVSYKVPHRQSFKASIDQAGAAILDLRENRLHGAGVADMVDCALLLQTDGLAFSLDVTLLGQTPFAGIRLTGSAELSIGQRYLWARPLRVEAEKGGADWCDVDSDEFLAWVREKTSNSWAERREYDMA